MPPHPWPRASPIGNPRRPTRVRNGKGGSSTADLRPHDWGSTLLTHCAEMPSFKPTQLWPAKPHTLAKIEIVRRYLYLWFVIFGANPKHKRLVYIDGFAGPGKYTNSDQSSPTAALIAARAAVQRQPGLASKECSFFFVEKIPEFANGLRAILSETTWPPQLNWSVEEGTFEEKMTQILDDLRRDTQYLPPTFAFIDPFGATGLPFKIVADILGNRSCEVLLNLDSDGIGRLVAAQGFQKNQTNLDSIFGDCSWRTELDPTLPMARLSADVLRLYKRRLRTIPKVDYVFPFAMNSKEGQLNYHLVFASQVPLGLEKMKETMKAVDQSGSYSFSDDSVGQERFRFDVPGPFALKMQAALGGAWRPCARFRDYALNETPFVNPKSMLAHLKKLGKVRVNWVGSASARGFPEAKIRSIWVEP